jgi:hypothetical protein
MRIELSPTISHDRRSPGFPGVAQFFPEQPPHRFLGDIRKFVGKIFARSSTTSPGLEHPQQTEGQSCRKWPANCFVRWHGHGDRPNILRRRRWRTDRRVHSVPGEELKTSVVSPAHLTIGNAPKPSQTVMTFQELAGPD